MTDISEFVQKLYLGARSTLLSLLLSFKYHINALIWSMVTCRNHEFQSFKLAVYDICLWYHLITLTIIEECNNFKKAIFLLNNCHLQFLLKYHSINFVRGGGRNLRNCKVRKCSRNANQWILFCTVVRHSQTIKQLSSSSGNFLIIFRNLQIVIMEVFNKK